MPSFKGQLTDEADRRRRRLRRPGDERRLIELPDGFPRDVAVVATRPRPHADRGRTRAAAAHAARRSRGARDAGLHVIVVTGRMFQSVRRVLAPAGLDDPVVCYQGAVVADADGALAAARADPARARARGDRRGRGRGLPPELLRRRRALRRRAHARGRGVRDLPAPRDPHRRRPRSPGSTEPPTKLVVRRRPGRARRARAAAERALRRAALHLEVAAVLPRVRAART